MRHSAQEAARLAALAEYKILDTPPEAPFDDLAALASQLLAAPIALIAFVDAHRMWFKARIGTDRTESPREHSFCDRALSQDDVFEACPTPGEPLFAGDPATASEPAIHFYAGAPLATPEGYRLGVLCVFDRVPRQLDDRQREALAALARQVVALLELRRALAQLSRSYQQLHLLAEMNRMLQLCSCCEDSFDIIASFGRQVFPDEAGCVYLRQSGSGELKRVSVWGGLQTLEAALSTSDCWALRGGQAHSVVNASGGLVCSHLAPIPLEYSLCVPLVAHSESLGVLSLVALAHAPPPSSRNVFLTESKKSLVVALAQSVALALGNLRLRETLESQSVRDPLTGLFNRRYLEESLDRELAHAARHQLPLGLIMIDLDNFKNYNDRFGHFAGDELLRTAAQLLRAGVRAGDIACRYGGDEFAVILPGASLAITHARADELCQSIKGLRNRFEQEGVEPITLSIGVAAYSEHGSAARDLLRSADVALYQAKAQGRDRSVVAACPAAPV